MAKGLSPKDEIKIYKMCIEGESTQEACAEELGVARSTIQRYIKKMRADDYELPELDLEEELAIEAELMTHEQLIKASFEKAVKMMYNTIAKAEDGYIIEDERKVRIPIKTIMECIEKAGRHAKTMSEAAALATKSLTPETIDYQEMAKLFVSFNEETGKFEYDESGHMRSVLDKAYSKEETQ